MDEPLDYLPREVRSYLPTGWNLADDSEPGRWEADRNAWVGQVLDGTDQNWELAVDAADADRHGRLEAIRLAFDRIYKRSLGRASILG